jgi:hypothetical protein
MDGGGVYVQVLLKGKALQMISARMNETAAKFGGKRLAKAHFVESALNDCARMLEGNSCIVGKEELATLRASAERLKKYEMLYGDKL